MIDLIDDCIFLVIGVILTLCTAAIAVTVIAGAFYLVAEGIPTCP